MMLKRRQQSTIDNCFVSKHRRVDDQRPTQDRNNENSSVDSDSSAVTYGKIVGGSLASVAVCSFKPNPNIENIITFCENDIGSYIDRIEKLDDRRDINCFRTLGFRHLATASLIQLTGSRAG